MTAVMIDETLAGMPKGIESGGGPGAWRTGVYGRGRRPRLGHGRACALGIGQGPLQRQSSAQAVALPDRRQKALLGAAALCFDAIVAGGFAVLVWAIVAGSQHASVLVPLL